MHKIDILIGVAERGGVENVVNMTASYLMRQGYSVRVVQIVWEGVNWTSDGVPFYPLIRGKHGHSLTDLAEAYQTFLYSGDGKDAIPDLVLACAWPYMTWIAKNTAVNLNLEYRIVSWLHAPVERYTAAGFGGYDALRFADAHLAISAALEADLRHAFHGVPVFRIDNPVDFSELEPLRVERGNTLYYVGRLAIEKRIDIILHALAQSESAYALTLIGSGEKQETAGLKQLVRERNLTDRVTFAGWRERPWNIVENAAALVLASEYEGFGLVAVEALALGIPVISTPVGIVPEIISPGINGYLFPAGDTATLQKIFDMMYAGLFPPVQPDACKESVRRFEKNNALTQLEDILKRLP